MGKRVGIVLEKVIAETIKGKVSVLFTDKNITRYEIVLRIGALWLGLKMKKDEKWKVKKRRIIFKRKKEKGVR